MIVLHIVTLMVRQGVVFVLTIPTKNDANRYGTNHVLIMWVQHVGCKEERKNNVYNQVT
jgi:hypothetical protein